MRLQNRLIINTICAGARLISAGARCASCLVGVADIWQEAMHTLQTLSRRGASSAVYCAADTLATTTQKLSPNGTLYANGCTPSKVTVYAVLQGVVAGLTHQITIRYWILIETRGTINCDILRLTNLFTAAV